MRLFIAVKTPKEIRSKIAQIQEKFEELDIDIKLVEPENLHFNLKFIGEYAEEKLPNLKKALDNICSQFSAFDSHIAGIGSFPSPTYIRVIWLGMEEGSQAFSAIAEALDMGLEGLGIAKNDKKFTPHLTLGRVRSGKGREELISLLRDLKNTDIGTFRVDKIILFESKLGKKGPVYTEVHSVKLG
ncbi:MAG: RNA 2',3'-cyclic phosphodiesterase [Candidatus Aenigmatarchaeota archaeon]